MSRRIDRGPRGLHLFLLVWIAWGLLGLIWTPYDPQAQAFRDAQRAGPSAEHWLGVDSLGRDVLSRVWIGTGRTIIFGAAAAAGSLIFASVLLVAERRGSAAIRTLIRTLVSAGLAMPVVFVALVLLVFLPQSPWTVVLGCALGGLPLAFRQLRVMWIEQTGALYVLASRALGASRRHIASFAIWPNIRPQAASLAKLLFAIGVLEFAGLSFLGLNGDPDLAELGAMLRQNQTDMSIQPLLVVWPGVLLSGLLFVVHLAGPRAGRGQHAR